MIPRHITHLLIDSLNNFPVVLLTGARQVGKSTLVQAISAGKWKARYLTLDDRTIMDAALTDPDGFLREIGQPVILDEVQRAPDLLRAVKLAVDRDRRPGGFLLTGSANILTLSTVSETLAGRVAVFELNPFSLGEINKRPVPSTIDDLFEAGSAGQVSRRWPRRSPPYRSDEIKRFILSGGFPTPCLMDSESTRRTWFESYRQTYIERDLRDVANLEHLPDFSRLMTTLALRTGQMLNLSGVSRDVGLALTTLRRYFHILSQTYQVVSVRPYFANIGKKLVKTPKVFITDTGFACHLGASDNWETLVRQSRVGPMAETWVMSELLKMISVSSWPTGLFYWRTRTGQEVDFILERAGELVGIEVKWGSGINERDLSGLRVCKETHQKQWRMGILLHGGSEAIAIDESTLAVPFGVFFGLEN